MTREGLRDGSLLASAQIHASPDFPVRSAREIEDSLQSILRQRCSSEDLWVFGYGSLMWNPSIQHIDRALARIFGWHRRFCLASTGRGTTNAPGAMLALDAGGSCRGVAFRIDAAAVEEELRLLWHREMLNGSYLPRWTTALCKYGRIPVLTFVANREHPRFLGSLSETEIIERLAFAAGPLGSSFDYLCQTTSCLAALGLGDGNLDRLRARAEALRIARGVQIGE